MAASSLTLLNIFRKPLALLGVRDELIPISSAKTGVISETYEGGMPFTAMEVIAINP